jgi:colicin import membrane protein
MAIRGTAAVPPLDGTVENAEMGLISVPVAPDKIQDLFATEGALTPLLDAIEAKAKEHIPDLSTKAGQDAIRSLAFQVTKAKTYLAKLKKGLTSDLKALPTRIDKNWLVYESRLEAIQEDVRKPLTEWEAEEERKEALRLQAIKDSAAAAQLQVDHEFGLLLNEKFDRDRAEALRVAEETKKREAEAEEKRLKDEADAAESLRLEDEARVRKEAEEKASRDAQAMIDKANQEKLDAENALAKAEQDRKDADARAEQEKKDSDARAEQAQKDADARAEQARLDGIEAERVRVAAVALKAKQEQDDRDRDVDHQKAFNGEALADLLLVKDAGLTDAQAKAVIVAIVKKQVRHVTLSY